MLAFIQPTTVDKEPKKEVGTKDPYLTFYLQSNFDAVADWIFCSSFRLQKLLIIFAGLGLRNRDFVYRFLSHRLHLIKIE